MQCPRCGHTNRIGAAFCADCGASLAYLQGQMRLQPGQTLKGGAYEVVRPLTQGGMGALYLVKDLEAFERLRILKEMLDYIDPADYPDRPSYEQAVRRAHERFEDEGRILASLHHPGIPEIITYFTELGRNYIVMEYVEGRDLNKGLTHVDDDGQLVKGQPYSAEDVVRWAIQVCKILEYLEGRKPTPVIHHDIKPANLVLAKNSGDIRLVDFGTAQTRLASQLDTRVGLKKPSVFGTIGYAPPEQYQGKSVPKSDVYALAATTYHLLTDDDPQQHPMSFPWPTALGRPLSRALGRAVEPDPRKRSSARQLRKALEQWLQKPQQARPSPKTGDFRVVLPYVPDHLVEQTVEALQQELSMTETEATLKVYSAPTSILTTTSYAAAEQVVDQLQAAQARAQLVEVDEHYSRSMDPGNLRTQLAKRGQTRKLMVTRLARDRRCRCLECGHEWTAPRSRGRRPPLECPQCKSRRWSARRVFKCRVCGHEFAHNDQESPPRQLFPACPACGTIDWLSRDLPALRVRDRKIDLGTVRIGEKASVRLSITNQGRGSLRGVVRCREPWLPVEKSFASPGRITLPINTALLSGERRYQGIVEVLSNGGAQQVRVEFRAQMPERVNVSPPALDFGRVDAQPALLKLQVTNQGGGVLRGTISSDAPWLALSSTELAGNRVGLSVVARPGQMPPGQALASSITLATNGGEVTVPVRAEAAPAKLELNPTSLDFRAVPPGEKQRQAVRLANAGAGSLQGHITSKPNWLSVSRKRWSGNAIDLVVEVDGRQLADGLQRTGVVHLSSNGGDGALTVQAAPLGPTLVVEPNGVDLGAVAAGGRARCRLRFTNLGSGRLSGTAHTTAPWLHVEPDQFAGKGANLSVWLTTKGLSPGRYAGAVEIESNGGNTSVEIRVQVTQRQSLRERLAGALSR